MIPTPPNGQCSDPPSAVAVPDQRSWTRAASQISCVPLGAGDIARTGSSRRPGTVVGFTDVGCSQLVSVAEVFAQRRSGGWNPHGCPAPIRRAGFRTWSSGPSNWSGFHRWLKRRIHRCGGSPQPVGGAGLGTRRCSCDRAGYSTPSASGRSMSGRRPGRYRVP